MAVNRDKLAQHLRDYTQVTGKPTDRFVCPITLRRCREDELVDGHILNIKLREASRKTIIQYGRVDHFFGSRAEPAVVQFLNESADADVPPLRHELPSEVRFDNGTTVKAFATNPDGFANAGPNFTKLEIPAEDGPVRILAELPQSDPRWSMGWKVKFQSQYRHFDWVAAMLKAGYLTLFDMIGYRAVCNPGLDEIRCSLKAYYDDNAKSNEADKYFAEFVYAVKMVGNRGERLDARPVLEPLGLDSIGSRRVFLHRYSANMFFAITTFFRINDVTASVTLPFTLLGGDAATVRKHYNRLVMEANGISQEVHRATYESGRFEVEASPLTLVYPTRDEWVGRGLSATAEL